MDYNFLDEIMPKELNIASTESLKWTYVEKIEDVILKLKDGNYHIVSIEQARRI